MSVASKPPGYPSRLPPLSFLVHPDPERLERELQSLSQGWPGHVVSVSRVLAQTLSQVPHERWALVAQDSLDKAISDQGPGAVLCTDLVLLFEPALAIDPLALLQKCASKVTLVVLWPGRYQDGVLTFGDPEHAHCRRWHAPNLSVTTLR